MRAVTFQSMSRMSSCGSYSRTSSNSMPRPLNTLWYSPANSVLTSRDVVTSMKRTLERISFGSMAGFPALRHFHLVEDHFHQVFGRLFLRFGFVGGRHAMAHHVEADRLDVVGHHVRAAAHESVSA